MSAFPTSSDAQFPLKRSPVRPHPRAFQRAYLGSLLSSHFDVPLVVVEAPRGFGKTTLLAALAHRANANVRWLSLDESDRDLDACVAHLCGAIAPMATGVGTGSGYTASQGARLAISALKEFSVDTLILDNYETVIAADPVNALLEQIIGELPPLTQIVIASQKSPPFKRAVRMRSRMMEVNHADLRFDADDIMKYFETVARYRLDPSEASVIAQRTAGQPVTVNLLLQLAYGLQSYLRINFDALPLAPGEQTLIYLLREVLKRLPYSLEEAARVLKDLRAASAPGDTADVDALLQPPIEEAVQAAHPLLERLAARYCLVQEVQDEPGILLPHPMLFDLGALL